MSKVDDSGTTNTQAVDGQPRPEESSVQSAAGCVEELIQHVKDELVEIDKTLAWNRKIGHRGDSKLKVVRQVYSDQVLCWLGQLFDKVAQVEQEAKRAAAD